MNRKAKILRHIERSGRGIEIGPSHNPVAPKKDGYQVHIIDHMSREQLIEKYQAHGLDLSQIEAVDFVWQGESYAELTGKTDYYDWIIASHVIEHAPDLISFINSCDEVLKADGVLSLVIPDKRYCFDHYRPITGLAKIIDNHLQKSINHTPGTIAEYFLNVVSQSGQIAWNAETSGDYQFVHSIDNALEGMASVMQEDAYIDVHAWCFVPHSFRLMMHDLFGLGLIALKEIDFYQTDGFEFYMTLGRQGAGIQQSRMDLLKQVDAEIAEGMQTPSRWRQLSVKKSVKRVARSLKARLRSP